MSQPPKEGDVFEVKVGFVYPTSKRNFTIGGAAKKQINKLKWANPDLFDDYGEPETQPQDYIINMRKLGEQIEEKGIEFNYEKVPIDFGSEELNKRVMNLIAKRNEQMKRALEKQEPPTPGFKVVLKEEKAMLTGKKFRAAEKKTLPKAIRLVGTEVTEMVQDVDFVYTDKIRVQIGPLGVEIPYVENKLQIVQGAGFPLLGELRAYRLKRGQKRIQVEKKKELEEREINGVKYALYDFISFEDSEYLRKEGVVYQVKENVISVYNPFLQRSFKVNLEYVVAIDILDNGNIYKETMKKRFGKLGRASHTFKNGGFVTNNEGEYALRMDTVEYRMGDYIAIHFLDVHKSKGTILSFMNDSVQVGTKNGLFIVAHESIKGKEKKPKKIETKSNVMTIPEFLKKVPKKSEVNKKIRDAIKKGLRDVLYSLFELNVSKENEKDEPILEMRLGREKEKIGRWRDYFNEQFLLWRIHKIRSSFNLTSTNRDRLLKEARKDVNEDLLEKIRVLEDRLRSGKLFPELRQNMIETQQTLITTLKNIDEKMKSMAKKYNTTLSKLLSTLDKKIFEQRKEVCQKSECTVQDLEKDEEWKKRIQDRTNYLLFSQHSRDVKETLKVLQTHLQNNTIPPDNVLLMKKELKELNTALFNRRVETLMNVIRSKYNIITLKNYVLPKASREESEKVIEGVIEQMEKNRSFTPYEASLFEHLKSVSRRVIAAPLVFTEQISEEIPTPKDAASKTVTALEYLYDKYSPVFGERDVYTAAGNPVIVSESEAFAEELEGVIEEYDMKDKPETFENDLKRATNNNELPSQSILNNNNKLPGLFNSMVNAQNMSRIEKELFVFLRERWSKGVPALEGREFYNLVYTFLFSRIKRVPEFWINKGVAIQRQNSKRGRTIERVEDISSFMARQARITINEIEVFTKNYVSKNRYDSVEDVYRRKVDAFFSRYLQERLKENVTNAKKEFRKEMLPTLQRIYSFETLKLLYSTGCLLSEGNKSPEEMAREYITKTMEMEDVNLTSLVKRVENIKCEKQKTASQIEEENKIKEKRKEIKNKVNKLEEKIFKQAKTYSNYLSSVVMIGVMANPKDLVGEFAQTFQAKIKSGMYDIENLTNATLAHYLPELVMGEDINSAGIKAVLAYLFEKVEEAAELVLYIIDPSRRRMTNPRTSFLNIVDVLKRSIKPVKERCNNNALDIKLENIIICSDKETSKYYCFDKDEIVSKIKTESVPINPYTKKPFDAEMIEKLKSRYT